MATRLAYFKINKTTQFMYLNLIFCFNCFIIVLFLQDRAFKFGGFGEVTWRFVWPTSPKDCDIHNSKCRIQCLVSKFVGVQAPRPQIRMDKASIFQLVIGFSNPDFVCFYISSKIFDISISSVSLLTMASFT